MSPPIRSPPTMPPKRPPKKEGLDWGLWPIVWFWLIPGVASLVVFALLLTLIPAEAAGRAFAAYGGVYILSSLAWMGLVEGVRPDRFDVLGAAVCLAGAAIILLAPRGG